MEGLHIPGTVNVKLVTLIAHIKSMIVAAKITTFLQFSK